MTVLRWFFRGAVVACGLGLVFAGPARAGEGGTFEKHVRPILKAHCFQCHGEDGTCKAGLDLRLVRLMTRGGESGEAVVAGRHEESLLWERLDADEMPPGDKKLSAAEKATIADWIDQGARPSRPEPASPDLAA